MNELLTYRIICGYLNASIKMDSKIYDIMIVSPTVKDLYESELIYHKALDLLKNDFPNEEKLLLDMIDRGQWSLEEEESYTDTPKRIDDLKVELYNCMFRSNSKLIIEKKIAEEKNKLEQLANRRSRYNHLSIEGLAGIQKAYYLASKCAKLPDGSFFLLNLDDSSSLIESVISIRNSNKITESQYRSIVRQEPWRSYWICGNPFNKCSTELTEEQKHLILYSKMYDNVYQSADCPGDDVIENDDALDGWFIIQRRKREQSQISMMSENKISKSVGKHENIFLPAETLEDAQKIESLNDMQAKIIKKQRASMLEQFGQIEHQNLPEEKMKIIQGLTNGS